MLVMSDSFSIWLNGELLQRGWSQAELARQANLSRTAISDVLSEKHDAGFDLCIAIARALHLPPESVFRIAGLLPPTPAHTEQKEELLYLFEQLPENQKPIAVDYIRFLVEKNEAKNKK
jgi:transcriptional regulator with XRE-family HTH domain